MPRPTRRTAHQSHTVRGRAVRATTIDTLILTQMGAGIAPTDQVLALLDVAKTSAVGEGFAWLCQCGHLNEGLFQDGDACGGCRFECHPDMVARHYVLTVNEAI